MPKQYVVCGRPVPRLGTRHISLLLACLALFALFSLLITVPGSVPGSPPGNPGVHAAGNTFSVPKTFKSPWMDKLNPFKPPSHPPRVQKGDTDGESVWHSSWNWLLMPFSGSVTLDENRALLPVLKERTPVYCYYDGDALRGGDRASAEAESALLLAWRRAWWAQGFRPIILTSAEATNNPLYEEVQKLQDISPALKVDLMRWLAWQAMGDGVLAHHLLFPMAPHDDPFLTYLRRGEFPKLTRFKDLDDGLLVGSADEVLTLMKTAMDGAETSKAEGVVATAESGKDGGVSLILVEDTPTSLAYYSPSKVEALYPKVGDLLRASHAAGVRSLTQLINSHLHLIWQNTFADGISVVKPLPHHTTLLITPAYELAQRLARCPESPLPESCPPNRLNCRPCGDSKPLKIATPSSYQDADTLYTIGTVPHPYTSSTLNYLKTQLSIPWIRRRSPRDAWITSLTSSLFTDKVSTTPRLIRFKEAVALDEPSPVETKDEGKGEKSSRGGGGAYRSLWLPAEQPIPDDLDWHFGFALPDRASYADQSSTAAADPATDPAAADTVSTQTGIPLHSPEDGPQPTESDLALEPALLSRAQLIVLSSSSSSSSSPPSGLLKSSAKPKAPQPSKEDLALRDAVEAWSLADTEAWRFARAYLARKSLERREWEQEESKYAGGLGTEKSLAKGTSTSTSTSNPRKGRGGRGAGGNVWDRWLDRD
ncbi:uncharacterized protein P884DRAFT_70351 [Thermothelomyces heterothallicus CBS 202.75]|uniref:uncharacterized protein n=1 Tax=Thermothelomyces heterothallicus CBS 202.75 TaxID=1149848 RepID=UPI0037422D28